MILNVYNMGVGAILGVAAGTAALGATSSAVGTSKTNSTNMQIAQMNNEFNERMLDKQMAYNTEMYERQLSDNLAYSDPSYIKSRLDDAGLNGALIMSGGSDLGSVSSVSGSAQGVAPPTASPVQVDYSGYQGIANALAEGFRLYQEYQNSESSRGYTDAMAEQVHIENQYKAQQAMSEITKNLASAGSEKERSANLAILNRFQESMYRQEMELKDKEIKKAENDYRMQCIQISMADAQLQSLPEMLRLDIANKGADLGLKYAQKELTKKQAEHEVSKIAETIARTGLADAQSYSALQSGNLSQSQAAGQDVQNQFDRETFEKRKELIEATISNMVFGQIAKNIFSFVGPARGKVLR